jgi:hypothetical protein
VPGGRDFQRGTSEETTIREHLTTADSDKVMTNPARRETEDETRVECVAARVAHMIEGTPLVLLQVNCRSFFFFNKTLGFWNLTYITQM